MMGGAIYFLTGDLKHHARRKYLASGRVAKRAQLAKILSSNSIG